MKTGIGKKVLLFLCLGLTLCLFGCEEQGGKQPANKQEYITFTMYSEEEISQTVLERIEQKLGVHLEMYYPEEGKKKSVEKMIAIGEIPDLIYTKTEGSQLVEAGILIDLRSLLKEYGQNIMTLYQYGRADMSYNPGDLRVLFMPVPEGFTQGLDTEACVYLQYDMMLEYDYGIPNSLDELGDLLRHYIKTKRELKEEAVIGLSFLCDEDTWLEGLSMTAGRIADGIEEQGQWLVDESSGYEVTYKHTTKEEKQFFQWLNQMYLEGILDRDFATQTGDDYLEKIKKGKVVCLLGSSVYMQRGEAYLVEKEKFGSTYLTTAIKMNQSQKWNKLSEGRKRGQGVGITTSCKNPEKAVELINALFGSEGEKLLEEKKETAAWQRLKEYKKGIANEFPFAQEGEEVKEKKFYARDIQQCDYELDEWTKKLDEISRAGLIQCMICGEGQFEGKWNTLQENLLKAGVKRAEIMMMKKYQDFMKE